jgi:hypothetical protein
MKKLLLALFISLSLLTPLQVQAAAPTCNLGSDPNIVRLNPAGISACLEEGAAGDRFGWIVGTWKWSLSVVNIFAVMVLVFMAFANILYPWKTLEPYRIRQLLPNFIFGIVLANLSLLIVKAIASIADILMNTPDLIPSAEKIWAGWGINMTQLPYGVVQAVYGAKGLSLTAGGMIYQFLLSLVLVYLPIIALFLLSIYFYVRFGVLFILTALAPLAFGSIIFPATKNFLTQWFGLFSKWLFGGVVAYLIMFLAIQVKGDTIISTTGGVGGVPSLGDINNIGINFIPYGISLGLFFAALVAPFKMGNFMVGFVSSIPKRAFDKSWGATKTATKFAANRGGKVAWSEYGNLMAKAAGNWNDPKKSAGMHLRKQWQTRSWVNPRKYIAGAGIGIGHLASNFNLFNAKELWDAKKTDEQRIRREASWESASAKHIAGYEPTFRYWALQNKGKYDHLTIPQLKEARDEKAGKNKLSDTFWNELATNDPQRMNKLSGTFGERVRASQSIYVDKNGNWIPTDPDTLKPAAVDPITGLPPDGTRSLADKYMENTKVEDLLDTTNIVTLIANKSEMYGKDNDNDPQSEATDETANKLASKVPDMTAKDMKEALDDAIRSMADRVVTTTPATGFAAGAGAGILAQAIEDRINLGRAAGTIVTLDAPTIDHLNQYQIKIKNGIDQLHKDTKQRVDFQATRSTTNPVAERPLKDGAMEAWKMVQFSGLIPTVPGLPAGAPGLDLGNLTTGQQQFVNQLKEMEIKLKTAAGKEDKDKQARAVIVNDTFTTIIKNGNMPKVTKDDVDTTVARLTKGAYALEHYIEKARTNPSPLGGDASQQLHHDLTT